MISCTLWSDVFDLLHDDGGNLECTERYHYVLNQETGQFEYESQSSSRVSGTSNGSTASDIIPVFDTVFLVR